MAYAGNLGRLARVGPRSVGRVPGARVAIGLPVLRTTCAP